MNEKVSLNMIVDGLNQDLKGEFTATIQYINHAANLHGAEYFAVIEELKKHADDEHRHAVILSDMITYLGGTLQTKVGEILTSNENVEMLKQDLKGEYDAIRNYNHRIEQLESLGLYDLATIIRGIAKEEQDHANDLEIALDRKRKAIGIPQNEAVELKIDYERSRYQDFSKIF